MVYLPHTLKKISDMSTVITQSSLQAYNSCPQLYEHKYVAPYMRPMTLSSALTLGSAFHYGIEVGGADDAGNYLLDYHGPCWTQQEKDSLALQVATVVAMVGGALSMWSDWPDRQEVEFTLPLINPSTGRKSSKHVFRGKLDGLSEGVVWEWKTTARLDSAYLDRLKLDFQVSAYMAAATLMTGKPVRKSIYRVVRKPSIKKRQKETVSEYAERLYNDYQDRPEFYFHEEIVTRTESQMDRWKKEAWEIHKRILDIENGALPIRNTRHCTHFGRCSFLALCSEQVGPESYRVLRNPHPELEEG